MLFKCFNYCQLIDLGFSGSKYTWTNKRMRGALIFERPDRIVANSEWLNIYPEAHVLYLPRTHSDHCPLMRILHKNRPHTKNIFRMKTMWLSHQEFFHIVDNIWNTSPPMLEAIYNFTSRVKIWNKKSFGNIFH